jgi:hypothetical protein
MEAAIHAAVQQQEERQRQKEEEMMTRYTTDELQNDWEFKIVRTADGRFHNPDILQQLMDEESVAGWQMLEKLDDNRVRFKRPISARRRDDLLPAEVDPYRTQIGRGLASSQTRVVLVTAVVAAVLIAGIVVFVLISSLP